MLTRISPFHPLIMCSSEYIGGTLRLTQKYSPTAILRPTMRSFHCPRHPRRWSCYSSTCIANRNPISRNFPLSNCRSWLRQLRSVFSAMEICRVMMKLSLPKNAIAVLAYTVRHGYPKLSLEAAPHTVNVEPKEAFEHLGHLWFVYWVLYREPYLKTLMEAHQPPGPGGHLLHRGGIAECDLWKIFQLKVTTAIGSDMSALNRINDIFSEAQSFASLSTCTQCSRRAETWSTQITKKISALPQFSLTL
ncbi:uncharacterized protein C8Q71DRAFT_562425 [Rhodofomes roseus]|uniref:Uncharacterized protein n=1 Tax=Rhodofomes roseus TaxID=34475 RepID=A0ABQ8KK44_9APHY|nr:uncharacterized protein C8Q71DRAFT_562425 [Rhodofomes roseus]KAH9837804.1 hypothetical protein C8Q71DRAFT_562425 [Rhodofomes roseus]